jgi:hypothetical protein
MNQNEETAKELIITEVKNAIATLESHYEKFCTDNGVVTVPIAYIKIGNKIFLDAYEKGIMEADKV